MKRCIILKVNFFEENTDNILTFEFHHRSFIVSYTLILISAT